MDMTRILAAVEKGLSVVTALAASEKKIEPAVKVVYDLVVNAQTGDVTDAQLDTTEATLDGMIEDFNSPID